MKKTTVKRMFELVLFNLEKAKERMGKAEEIMEEIHRVVPDDEYTKIIDKMREVEREIERLKEDVEWEKQII